MNHAGTARLTHHTFQKVSEKWNEIDTRSRKRMKQTFILTCRTERGRERKTGRQGKRERYM